MRNVILGIIIAALGASTYYYYTEAQSRSINRPTFGNLFAVNRIILSELPITDKCRHLDDKGLGKGIIDFYWQFDAGYGVDIPADYKWNVVERSQGNFEIKLPALTQLHPIVADFLDMVEIDPGNGNRWERMVKYAKVAAQKRTVNAVAYYLHHNPKLHEQARSSAERLFLGILRPAFPEYDELSVSVQFEQSGSGPSKLIDDPDC